MDDVNLVLKYAKSSESLSKEEAIQLVNSALEAIESIPVPSDSAKKIRNAFSLFLEKYQIKGEINLDVRLQRRFSFSFLPLKPLGKVCYDEYLPKPSLSIQRSPMNSPRKGTNDETTESSNGNETPRISFLTFNGASKLSPSALALNPCLPNHYFLCDVRRSKSTLHLHTTYRMYLVGYREISCNKFIAAPTLFSSPMLLLTCRVGKGSKSSPIWTGSKSSQWTDKNAVGRIERFKHCVLLMVSKIVGPIATKEEEEVRERGLSRQSETAESITSMEETTASEKSDIEIMSINSGSREEEVCILAVEYLKSVDVHGFASETRTRTSNFALDAVESFNQLSWQHELMKDSSNIFFQSRWGSSPQSALSDSYRMNLSSTKNTVIDRLGVVVPLDFSSSDIVPLYRVRQHNMLLFNIVLFMVYCSWFDVNLHFF